MRGGRRGCEQISSGGEWIRLNEVVTWVRKDKL
jgi:hypothetical protein